MTQFPSLLVVGAMLAVVLGVPFGPYALMTRGRRRLMDEIKSSATRQGWEFRRSRWGTDPTEFRLDGWSRTGSAWSLKSTSSCGHDRGWTHRLSLRFPTLGGEVDLAVYARDVNRRGSTHLTPHLSSEVQAKVAAFSGTAASAVGFLRDAQELPSGLPAFDAAYRVLALTQRFTQAPIDPALAGRVLKWPADSVAAHSVLAWRDPCGLHLQARLPAMPNWASITHLVSLAEDFCARLPSPVTSPAPQGLVDRIVARFMGS